MQRIAIIGGTFDPIHYGHLRMGEMSCEKWAADLVLFVPNGQPPHKLGVKTSKEHRLNMTRLATAGVDYFDVSDIETEDEGYYYTHDTLQRLAFTYPAARLGLVIGADEAVKFMEWRFPEKIIDLADLLIVERPSYDVSYRQMKEELPSNANFVIIGEIGFPMPSTALRAKILQNESVRFLVPDAVNEYINEHHIYSI